jgi:signal transduction histidine kinase/ligand-binding sensor domain-containing protein
MRRLICSTCMAIVLVVAATVSSGATERETPTSQFTRRSWTRGDGLLLGSQIWAIAQDRTGYLWLGTNEGLVRFDGVRFVSWATVSSSPLPAKSVRSLCVARDGSLWIAFGGDGGVARFHDGKLKTYGYADGLLRGTVTALLEDSEGTIWAAGVGGAARFRDGQWQRLGDAEGLPERAVVAIYEDRGGSMWLATSSGVFRRAAREHRFRLSSPGLRVQAFSQDSTGSVWAVGDALLTTLDGAGPLRTAGVTAPVGGWRLLHDTNGGLWIATSGQGLVYISDQSGRTVVERHHGESALTSDVVRSLLQDREGNIWVGTQSGLDRLSRGAVTSVPRSGDSMSRHVRTVATDTGGSTWVGTVDGLYRFRGPDRQRYDRSHGLPSNAVVALHPDDRNGIFVATERGVGYLRNGRFEPVALRQFGRVYAMTTDPEGGLWLCDLDEGLMRWHHGYVESFSRGDGRLAPFSAFRDKAGRVWIGFVEGAVMMYERGHTRFFSESDGLAGGSVVTIYQDSRDVLWVGSTLGLSRFSGDRFESLRWRDRFPGNTVAAVIDDAEGNLWLGVSAGIVRLERGEFDKAASQPSYRARYQIYEASDGLRGDPISLGYPTVARTSGGSLWFVTSDGVAVINPGTATKHRLPPPVVIETIVADERAIAPSTQRLPPLTSTLQIDYAALSFAAPEKVTFKYLMEGFNKEWVDAGVRRQTFYTNLPAGAYRFRVVALNDNVPSLDEAVWEFAISPVFYQTRWFPLLLLAIGMVGAAVAWRARVRQVKGRFSLILVERTRLAREIHDTLLQSLVGVLLQLDGVSTTLDNSAEQARDNLQHLKRQVEFYIREARQSIRDLRSPVLQDKDVRAALREAGERITGGSGTSLNFQVSGRPKRAGRRVDENLLRIGQEALANAVRHGRPTTISVQLHYDEAFVLLRVQDDGTGFDPALANCGPDGHWGVVTMRERAEQLGGTFTLTSSRGKGTTVEVSVPV